MASIEKRNRPNDQNPMTEGFASGPGVRSLGLFPEPKLNKQFNLPNGSNGTQQSWVPLDPLGAKVQGTEPVGQTHFKSTFSASFKQESPRPKIQVLLQP